MSNKIKHIGHDVRMLITSSLPNIGCNIKMIITSALPGIGASSKQVLQFNCALNIDLAM